MSFKTRSIKFIIAGFMSALALPVSAGTPATRIYDGEKLAKVKASLADAEYAPAYRKLLRDADKALKAKPLSVMDKEITAASGDKHDYVSMGPYWWPDPSKPDGLPYIRRDGDRNPAATADRVNIGRTINNILTLGTAFYFSDDDRYAAKAAELVRTWFINPDTRMNPNMNYAQMIPGHNNGKGRGYGMIDVYAFTEMLDVVELMKPSESFTEVDREGLRQWFREYLEWIRTSPVADEERTALNNHGLAFDVQTAAYNLFVGDEAAARKIVGEFAEKRLYPQIERDGRMPLELERNTGFGYTNFNLIHMMDMCALGRTLGIDVYANESPDGRSIRKALEYMASFLGKDVASFPYKQIKGWDKEQQSSCWILRRAGFYDKTSGWSELSGKYLQAAPDDRRRLLFSLD